MKWSFQASAVTLTALPKSVVSAERLCVRTWHGRSQTVGRRWGWREKAPLMRKSKGLSPFQKTCGDSVLLGNGGSPSVSAWTGDAQISVCLEHLGTCPIFGGLT